MAHRERVQGAGAGGIACDPPATLAADIPPLPRPTTDPACVRIGLLFEQTRGRDVQALLLHLGAGAWIGVPLSPAQEATRARALHRRLARSPSYAVISALKATASPEALRPLLALLARLAPDPSQEALTGAVLDALLSMEWPEAHQAAQLAAAHAHGEPQAEAHAWLTLHPPHQGHPPP